MNIQQLFGQAAKGNKTNPDDERQAISKAVFGQKKNFVAQMVEASEKNLGVNSSCMDSEADSESSSDCDDFVFEEIVDDINESLVSQTQAIFNVKLYIKPKNPDHMDDSPKIELITTRRAVQPSVFLKKVQIAEPVVQKNEESMQSEKPHVIDLKPAKVLGGISKVNAPKNQLLCETSPADQVMGKASSPANLNPEKAGMSMHVEQEDEVVQLY